MLDMIDTRILIEISDDLNITKDIFEVIGKRVGISKGELLNRLVRMQDEGILKRIAPIVKHYNTKYVSNAMVVWRIDDDAKWLIEGLIKNNDNISHVYERESREEWPYNFYTMIHGESSDEIENIVYGLSKELGSKTYKILYTKHQWKKTSPDMKYYLSLE